MTGAAAARVGVYGGAFDPPHLAHLALAQAAVTQLQLDALHIVPTGQAWHKARALSSAAHRLAMAELAFAGLARVQVDAQETQRQGPSYTVDTLLALGQRYPQAQLFLIIGTDQARALPTWQRWQTLLSVATICIADRAVKSPASSQNDLEPLAQPQFLRLELPLMPQSSTDIRQRAASGLGISHLVPDPIARYIAQHQLYQNPA